MTGPDVAEAVAGAEVPDLPPAPAELDLRLAHEQKNDLGNAHRLIARHGHQDQRQSR